MPMTPPPDPRTAALVRALSRRSVLRGAGAAGAAAFLAACGAKSPDASPSATPSGSASGSTSATPSPSIAAPADRSDTDKVVRWANWPEYLDVDGSKYPTLLAFQSKTGIKATYAEDIDGNDTYYAKIQAQMRKGQDIGKDIIVFTDWMAARCIRNGFAQQFDEAAIPNKKNILSSLAQIDYDPGRKYSLTWQSGFAGIGYRKDKVKKPIKTVADLWDPSLKGRVVVLDEMRDTVGLIMLSQGKDISGSFTDDDFMAAIDELQKQVDSGQVRQVKGNSYIEDLRSGDALAAIGWSGDVLTAQNEEGAEKFEFVIPESGGTLWSDNMLIPIGSPHKKNAESLINYYYDPTVAATVAAYVNYICPVEGAKEKMVAIDKSLATSPFIFPTDATLGNVKSFRTLTPEQEITYNEAFQKVIGA